jgi:CCR4-NOT transcription complex subunit 4
VQSLLGSDATVDQQLPVHSNQTFHSSTASNTSSNSLPSITESVADAAPRGQAASRVALPVARLAKSRTSSPYSFPQTVPAATPAITRPGDITKEEFPALASPSTVETRLPLPPVVSSKKTAPKKGSSKLNDYGRKNDDAEAHKAVRATPDLQQVKDDGPTKEVGPSDASERHRSLPKVDTKVAIRQIKDAQVSGDSIGKNTVPTSAEESGSRSDRPVVIRVLSTSQSAGVSTKTTQPSQASIAKQPSRQPSVSSFRHPGTPTSEIISDTVSSTSASVSRASSPQPSIIGSVPVRHITKSQLKKQRKESKKEQERRGSELSSAISSITPMEPEQAPIIGRKKKKARQVSSLVDDSNPDPSRQPSPDPQVNARASKVAPKENPEARPRSDTAKQAEQAEKAGAVGKSEMIEKPPVAREVVLQSAPTAPKEASPKQPSVAAKILSEMQASGELDAAALGFFDYVEGLNHKHNISSNETNDWEHKFMVSPEHEKDLLKGHSLRGTIGNSGQLSSRVMISPSGWFLRGLPQEQEDRFEEMEDRCRHASRPGTWIPDRQMGPSSFEIISGRFIQSGPRAAPGNAAAVTDPLSKMRIEEALNYINQFVATTPLDSDLGNGSTESTRRVHSAEDNGEAPEPSRYTPYYEQSFATELNRDVADLLDSMDGDDGEYEDDAARGRDGGRPFQLRLPKMPLMSVDDAESAMLVSRKETEAWEKKLLGVMRRNKKILTSTEIMA